MKVVFTNRSDCMTHRGGDTTQMLLTKKYLEANHPVEVSLCFNPTELKSKKADLVHVFNTQTFRESRAFLDIAKEMGWKTALSTIYWNMDYSIAAYGLFLLSLKKPRRIFRAISHPLVKLTSLLPGTRYLSSKYRN
jgi:hypothetical protein